MIVDELMGSMANIKEVFEASQLKEEDERTKMKR